MAWIASKRALAHPFADGVGVLAVDVQGGAPGRLVLVREVRAVGEHGLVPGSADVVVDHVEHDSQADGVGGVDELLERLGAAVGGLGRAEVDAVVAPTVPARELGHGHQLEHGHAQVGEALQVRDRAGERALGRERADVQLVDHGVVEARGAERVVGPPERAGVEHA